MAYSVIAIEREYASGGREVGEKLAAKLKIPCYGQEILEKAAAKLKLPLESLTDAEENMTGSFLYGLVALTNISSGKETDYLSLEQRLSGVEDEVIREMAKERCVIVGRAASALLADKKNVLKVFVHADYTARVNRAASKYGVDKKQAGAVLRRQDKRRANYFKVATGLEWKDGDIYHIFLNSGKIGIDNVVEILYGMAK